MARQRKKTAAYHIDKAEDHLKAALKILQPLNNVCLVKAEGFIEGLLPRLDAAFYCCKDSE